MFVSTQMSKTQKGGAEMPTIHFFFYIFAAEI